MDEFHDDDWIQDNFPAEIRRLHALGVIHVYWNQCENALFWLFAAVAKLPEMEAWAIAHDLGDIAICTRIAALLRVKGRPEAAQYAIGNVLAVYDVCRQNRNQLTHFGVAQFADNFTIGRKSKKPDSRKPGMFPSSIEHVRRVVDEIKALEERMWFLTACQESFDNSGQAPWPAKLPLPEMLWKPPPPTPPERPSRQRASPGVTSGL